MGSVALSEDSCGRKTWRWEGFGKASEREDVLTHEDRWEEVVFYWRSVLLEVALIVVEWTIFAASLEGARIFDHLGVEVVDLFMWDDIVDHDQSVLVEVAYGSLDVASV